jgi:hypothetical protein
MLKQLFFITMLVFLVGLTPRGNQSLIQIGNWKLLGTVVASHNSDHDVILVKGPYDNFKKLKFKVTDSPLILNKMIVRYDDGGRPENINTKIEIPKGGESRVIDLNGGRRKIKSVEFWYETKGILNGKANLT